MVRGRHGLAENGLKCPESQEKSVGHHRRFADPIRARPAAAGQETLLA